jgi:putative tricarboxylic transport membrane protein
VTSGSGITPLRRLQAALPYVVVLAVGIFLYHAANNFEFEQVSGRIGPGAWPKLILALMLATALWGVVSSALRAGESAAQKNAESDEAEAYVRPPEIYPYRLWFAVGATLCYLLALPVLGFFLSTIIYSFGLMYLGQFRRPMAITLLSLAIGLGFMFVFMRVVYVALPLGIAPFNQVSYALMTAMGVH